VNIIVYILFVHILQIGLRTLVIARRRLTLQEYDAFNEMLKTAKSSLGNRDEEVHLPLTNSRTVASSYFIS